MSLQVADLTTLNESKIYQCKAIIAVLQKGFATGASSVFNIFSPNFVSSLPDDPRAKEELEIPAAMLAFAATMVCAPHSLHFFRC
jgi:hypothetical protein